MIQAAFRIIEVDYAKDLALLRIIREAVFVIEQQVPLAIERDELDSKCRHVLAVDAEERPIGTGRLTPMRTIGRMAVLADWRGKGVGEALLGRLIAHARTAGWPSVSLHAQVEAIGFYRKHGFLAEGDIYAEAGIPHQTMSLDLTNHGN
ncbi:MAG: GNAT family N-acetyltransferase [Arenimonas sp.]|jgi:predicted GNAT family N-acyltransferase|uniref:GNAT family N-acetyltransferase n=1 Tax=Arenimonas sp. TaxID=1872635 RepID=UPI001B6E2FE1|nr:GNAT family N-acetyltransferase [Arenimonas sp.]